MVKKMYNKEVKKVNKSVEKYYKNNQKIFNKWGYYVENADRDYYKNLGFSFNFNFEFDKDKVIKFINESFSMDIPSIQEINIDLYRDTEDPRYNIDEYSMIIYDCFFSRTTDETPFRKIGRLDLVEQYIKDFPEIYRDICNVFLNNYKLIYQRYAEVKKEVKLGNIDKSILRDYTNIIHKYRKYNRRLFKIFINRLNITYSQCTYMYSYIGGFLKSSKMVVK